MSLSDFLDEARAAVLIPSHRSGSPPHLQVKLERAVTKLEAARTTDTRPVDQDLLVRRRACRIEPRLPDGHARRLRQCRASWCS
jgi:hypothetical protein